MTGVPPFSLGRKRSRANAEDAGKERLVYLIAFSSLLPLIPASLCLSALPTVSGANSFRDLSRADPSDSVDLTLAVALNVPFGPRSTDKCHHRPDLDPRDQKYVGRDRYYHS